MTAFRADPSPGDAVDAHLIFDVEEDNGVDLNETPMTLGPVLKMDARTETFTNNNAANAMLTRKYRKNFEVSKLGKVSRPLSKQASGACGITVPSSSPLRFPKTLATTSQ